MVTESGDFQTPQGHLEGKIIPTGSSRGRRCSRTKQHWEEPLVINVSVSAGKEREHNLQAGDNVEVCEGELINLQGKILSVDGNKITIMPKHEDLKVREELTAGPSVSSLLEMQRVCVFRTLWSFQLMS